MKKFKGLMTSNSGEWSTPQDLFDELNKEFHFVIDVCSSDINAKCKKHFTKENSCFQSNWESPAFMNPPYGREIGNFIAKARDEQDKGITIVALLPARTDTKWFHNYILGKQEIRFIEGRLKFGGSKNSAPFPSMIVIFRGKK